MSNQIDPLAGLGNEALFEIAADVQVQLERGTALRPVLWLLVQQRQKAAEAMAKMVQVDVSELDAMRALQNEIQLYRDLVEGCRALLVRGREADREIAEKDRTEMAEIIGSLNPDEQRLYRVPTGDDD